MNVGHIGIEVLGINVFDIVYQNPMTLPPPPIIGMALNESGGIGAGFRPL